MIWKTVSVTMLAAFIIGFGASNASAQFNGGHGAGRIEVTGFPAGGTFFTSSGDNGSFGDYGLGGAFALNLNRFFGLEGELAGGVGASQNLTSNGQRITSASTPRTLTYNGNVVFNPAGSDRSIVPYVTGGIGGLTMFSRSSVTQLGVTDTETFFTGNVGGGVRWFATPLVGFRADYRLIAVRSNDDAPAFFARDDPRYGHRIYGGIVLTGIR
jgi:hypothetical protein